MTKEEIIEFCEMKAELESENEDIYEAIIKLLEQQPILDNGRMTIAQIYENAKRRLDKNEITIGEFCNVVDITVDAYKPPIGHNCNEDYADCDQFVCSECGIELQDWHRVERDLDDEDISYHEYTFKFCPNCGARMTESEEQAN